MDEAEICDKVAIMDDGKIMVNDTPENLKRLYTKDKAIVQVSNSDLFEAALNRDEHTYKRDKETFYIDIDSIQHFLEFIEPFKNEINNLEIKKGTLNDVFLEITGKEIREESAQ
ncbi:hypothetical protein [Halolactibacillus sp. JCM 19043]